MAEPSFSFVHAVGGRAVRGKHKTFTSVILLLDGKSEMTSEVAAPGRFTLRLVPVLGPRISKKQTGTFFPCPKDKTRGRVSMEGKRDKKQNRWGWKSLET